MIVIIHDVYVKHVRHGGFTIYETRVPTTPRAIRNIKNSKDLPTSKERNLLPVDYDKVPSVLTNYTILLYYYIFLHCPIKFRETKSQIRVQLFNYLYDFPNLRRNNNDKNKRWLLHRGT